MKTEKEIIIDATNKSVGRLASQIAIILRGKDKVSFRPNINDDIKVIVENTRHFKFTGKKLEQNEYIKHTNYPGGLRRTPLKKVFNQKPAEVLRRAVWNMLPKNKTRKKIIKNLIIK